MNWSVVPLPAPEELVGGFVPTLEPHRCEDPRGSVARLALMALLLLIATIPAHFIVQEGPGVSMQECTGCPVTQSTPILQKEIRREPTTTTPIH